MFESAELDHQVKKSRYEKEAPRLRSALLDAQFDVLQHARFPVIVVVGGVEGAGKGELVNLLHTWMDPHHVRVVALDAPTDEERERPHFWRFWRNLPPKGETGIFFGSWYTRPIEDRVHKNKPRRDYVEELERIERFERLLTADGALLLKFWLHLSKKAQRKRFEALQDDKLTRWRVTKVDWQKHAHYDRYREVSEETLRRTSTGEAPWIVIDGADERYRNLTVGRELLEAMRRRLKGDRPKPKSKRQPRTSTAVDGVNALSALDLDKELDSKRYPELLEKYQGKLNRLVRDKRFQDRALVVAFEGVDAAGKGGAIERVISALDARWYRVVPVAAPTEEERAQPYLWRFWRRLPRVGHVTLFDRSWYGRVLVERVEGYASTEAWSRAYGEINDFEAQLNDHGTVVSKFWLQISPDVQLERFKEREAISYKRYKITPDDWRNRRKWEAYQEAAAEMVDRTSTEIAPWTLVPATDKQFARVHVLKTLTRQLERALDR
ncbi:MAG: polyphosphate:AMP phosphotransferase [Deltaproteobacteria bacterium]|nr:polyphosphate:AMP phosphotransferase [Deltaproteobacteria bacterium]